VLGISERRVQQLGRDWRVGHGKYDLARAVQAYIAAQARPDDALDPQRERALLDLWRRREVELRTRQRAGELAEVAQFEKVWGEALSVFRSRLLQMPHRLAPLIAAQQHESDYRSTLDQEARRMLEEFTKHPGFVFDTAEMPEIQD
jgi:hypothetical protein